MTSSIPDRIPDLIEQQRRSPSGIVASLAPSIGFLAANNWFGLVAGMVAATVLSAALIAIRRGRGQAVGWLLPISLGYVMVRGVAGVMTGSENVFFGFGVATSAAVAVAVGVSAFTRHPIAGYLLPLVVRYRHLSMDHPLYRRVAAQITVVWAIAELALTTWEAWHLSNVTGAQFLIDRTLIGWPVMAVVIFLLIFYVRFRLDPHERHLASMPQTA
ncbi:MAG: DUF3159 domain-containing protein [Acidimicrobiia bacterium]|nr:DUF3159 domain-containing protein [Acidimicrobiia bacterium]